MLKRYQVLLNDWLGDLIKFFSEKYDVSFSETIRLMLCMQLEHLVTVQYPRHKFGISLKEVVKGLEKAVKADRLVETHHKLMSKIYFEGRKTAEYILAQEKKRKR